MDKLWKQNERWWARKLTEMTGKVAERVPINGRGEEADVQHEDYPTECKERQTVPQWMLKALDQSESAMTRVDQTPVVQVHIKGESHEKDIIMMRLSSFERLITHNNQQRKKK